MYGDMGLLRMKLTSFVSMLITIIDTWTYLGASRPLLLKHIGGGTWRRHGGRLQGNHPMFYLFLKTKKRHRNKRKRKRRQIVQKPRRNFPYHTPPLLKKEFGE